MRPFRAVLGLIVLAALAPSQPVQARTWELTSPDHRQTFAYGTETQRAWIDHHGHLGLVLHFTNDPYVDIDNPRRYDDFTFDFPGIRLGQNGHTFFYASPQGRLVPVAFKTPGLFGDEVALLPSSFLLVQLPHGWISVTLILNAAQKRVTKAD